MTPLEWTDLIRNSALTIASLLGAGIGFAGLRSWKAQKRWERDNELARRFLLSLIKYQSAIKEMRFRTVRPTLVPQIETPRVLRKSKEDSFDEVGFFKELAEHVVKKSDTARDLKIEFETVSLEARAIWNWPEDAHINKLFALHAKLLTGLEWYLSFDDPSADELDRKEAGEIFEKYGDVVIEPTRVVDQFQKDLEAVISDLEMFLKTKLDVSKL
ncbi:hypothetical protein [Ruegeria profundi]|uniref:hypothetical protein n=1 Tax=Ruegeria profundi TaxID=1685378 RepID=UPI003C7AD6C9